MATKTITRVDPVQYGKILAIIMAIFYGIAGLFVGLGMGAMFALVPGAGGVGVGAVAAILGLVGGIFGGLIMGFIAGIVGAFAYNVLANAVGGIKIDLE